MAAAEAAPNRKLVPAPNGTGLYYVRWETGGGSVPIPLQGLYTSEFFAQKAIDLYMKRFYIS